MIDAAHALDFLGHAVLITLEPDVADRLAVDTEVPGIVRADTAAALGLEGAGFGAPDTLV